jgi:type II secretory ATPase GspE/PulE/Tfp pilus assembly ATPase PilB-like protein
MAFEAARDRQYDLDFCASKGLCLLSLEDGIARIGCAVDPDPPLKASLSRHHGPGVILKFEKLRKGDFEEWLSRASIASFGDGRAAEASTAHSLDAARSDLSAVGIVDGIIREALRLGASDIHIESLGQRAQARFRVDGALRRFEYVPGDRFPEIASRIKVLAGLDLTERRLPQDGRMSIKHGGSNVDLRVSTMPLVEGESIVLRVLGKGERPLALSELGFDARILASLEAATRLRSGLVLISGPTGSGKTTSLAAMLGLMPSEELKIASIEDPVEYVLEGVRQTQINEAIGLGFGAVLKRCLRQDPDVIMVGELRDGETAELAVRAALTGHLVLATVHAMSAASVIARLLDLGVEAGLLAEVLRLSLAQRLVRALCPACRREREASVGLLRVARGAGIRVTREFAAGSCELCASSGYSGRLAIGELIESSGGIASLIASRAGRGEIEALAAKEGFTPLARAALEAVSMGKTSFDEARRELGL